jgi:hypothetical protein
MIKKMPRKFLLLLPFILMSSFAIGQLNMRVGYSGIFPRLGNYNSLLDRYNTTKSMIVDEFSTNHLVSSLDIGFRYRIGDNFGLEASTQIGQTNNNKSSYQKADQSLATEKLNLRYLSYSLGMVSYFDMLYFGASMDYVDLAFRRNLVLTNKYSATDESNHWATTFFIGFEARSNRSSIAIRPFYRRAWGGYSVSNLASSLAVTGQSSSNQNPHAYGISILIFNGKSN